MAFVLDASVTAAWALQEETDPRASAAWARIRTEEAVAPALWWFEIRNVLVVSERRGRMDAASTAMFLNDLSALRIRVDQTPDEGQVLRLARDLGLSVYDAAYLELAGRERVALASLDAALEKAAKKCGVKMVGRG